MDAQTGRRVTSLVWLPPCWYCWNLPMSAVTPILFAGVETLSLRQLDELNGVPKGTTFRWFKRCETELVEGSDYFRLDAEEYAGLIDRLRANDSIYLSTRHLLLLTREGCQRLRQGSQG